MTIVVKNPLTLRRLLPVLVIIVMVGAVAVPVALYWALQRSDMHLRWDVESRAAQEFWSHTGYDAALINGSLSPWNNVTGGFAVNELGYADDQLYAVSGP